MFRVPDNKLPYVLIGLGVAFKKKARKNRKVWCKKWLGRRPTHGHSSLLRELTVEPGDYQKFLRITLSITITPSHDAIILRQASIKSKIFDCLQYIVQVFNLALTRAILLRNVDYCTIILIV